MNIDVLLAGNDETYLMRLAEAMRRKNLKTSDTLKISLYTDTEKLRQKKGRYQIALIEETVDVSVLDMAQIPLIFRLSEESDRDGSVCPLGPGQNGFYLYKYQRVSGILDKMLYELAKKRVIDKQGSAVVHGFFSPGGGSGTSTVAAAYALAAAKTGKTPLYVSFEYFNATEVFFSDPQGPQQGLYEVFCVIAEDGGVVATLDAIKNKDKSGVEFLRRFSMWTEPSLIKPDDIGAFINAARASNGVDVVVLDMGSTLAPFTEHMMESADELFIVTDSHKTAQVKVDMLFNDNTFFSRSHMEKVNLIYNKTTSRQDLPDYDAKSVSYMPRLSGNSASALLEAAANELRSLVAHG